eukprot:scaffold413163_cov19-Prasinocladus_malaysianus.AAC.1
MALSARCEQGKLHTGAKIAMFQLRVKYLIAVTGLIDMHAFFACLLEGDNSALNMHEQGIIKCMVGMFQSRPTRSWSTNSSDKRHFGICLSYTWGIHPLPAFAAEAGVINDIITR